MGLPSEGLFLGQIDAFEWDSMWGYPHNAEIYPQCKLILKCTPTMFLLQTHPPPHTHPPHNPPPPHTHTHPPFHMASKTTTNVLTIIVRTN